MSTSELGPLVEPTRDRDECERVRECLGFESTPSQIERCNGYVRATWTYKDTWPGDNSPDFTMTLAVPEWYTWGKKKREKKLKELRGELL